MTLLGPGEVQARRRPLVVLSVAALRLLAGFCLAFPLASLLGSSGVGAYADGERVLFEGGGYLLLEVLRLQGSSLLAAMRGLIPVLGVGLLLTALCNAALLVALNVSGRLELRAWLSRALERLPGVVVLGVGTALGQGVLFGLGMMLSAAVPDSMSNPVRSSLLELAAWLVVALGGRQRHSWGRAQPVRPCRGAAAGVQLPVAATISSEFWLVAVCVAVRHGCGGGGVAQRRAGRVSPRGLTGRGRVRRASAGHLAQRGATRGMVRARLAPGGRRRLVNVRLRPCRPKTRVSLAAAAPASAAVPASWDGRSRNARRAAAGADARATLGLLP